MQPNIIDIIGTDESLHVSSCANEDSVLEVAKAKFMRQSIKRGLDDMKNGRVQDGDFIIMSMIDAEDK